MQGFDTVQVRGGTLVLTGNNQNFTGQTTVYNGAILRARAQSLPTTSGDNTNNIILNQGGELNIDQPYADDGTYVGQIVGSGFVRKTGGGTVTLSPDSGKNTYSGDTLIENGFLAISSNNALGVDANGASLGNVILVEILSIQRLVVFLCYLILHLLTDPFLLIMVEV